ncbi:MAG: hypothetical protein KF866_01565 [Phycisphaeraceae bacterium]|nr:hypothetical protein [Phycisphaeraceae bacterium]MCW5754970.1 hypothetical protein [Phycisphaeraceae bacterium]
MIAALSTSPLVPAWFAVPFGMVTLLILAGHVSALRLAVMPESRRRIRQVNGMVMMCTVPMLTYALAVTAPAQSRAFVLSWSATVMLLAVVLALSIADVLNTMRLHRADRRRLKRELRDALTGREASGTSESSRSLDV